MASPPASRATSPAADEPSFPQFPPETTGPPSIISSRMTDIASDDGGGESRAGSPKKAGGAPESTSRPGTAKTGLSSLKNPYPQNQSLRRGLSAKRTSMGATSIAGSATGAAAGRPTSSTSRSHVPSLTSYAFFHPLSSQKLQAQRGASRPATVISPQSPREDTAGSGQQGGGIAQQSAAGGGGGGGGGGASEVAAGTGTAAQQTSDDGAAAVVAHRPTSRGSEMTERETLGRITANTSPTHGHYPAGSLTESVRPLQKKAKAAAAENKGLSIRVDKGYKNSGTLPPPPALKSPRSFRSSFLLPTKGGGDSSQSGPNRNMQGGEKLDSVASTPQLSPSVAHAPEGRSTGDKIAMHVGRNFEYFEGNTVFFLGGRFQNTRSRPINIATGSLVVLPCVLFFIFSAPWLWHNISPAVPLVFAYTAFLCVSSFLHASASDPGILPRNVQRFPPLDETEDPLRPGPPLNDWTLIRSAESSTAAMEVPTKYCKTCHIWRPPRAHHCRICDNCVETADHHCVWLNNCVGRRNYRYFFAFVASCSLLALYLIGASLAQILVYMNRESVSFGGSISHFRVPFAMVIYGFVGGLYPLALMGYHVFLMARGETTREFLTSHKFAKKDRYRAFTQGNWVKNWTVVLCRPRPPTYYRFKSRYAPGDQRLAAKRKGRPAAAAAAAAADSKDGLEMQDVNPTRTGFQGPASLRGSAPTSA